MRKERNAPVDEVGAEASATASDPPEDRRFQTLIGLLLSSMTKDQQTNQAISNLKKDGLNVQSILKRSEEEIDKQINVVGFHKTKAKNIKKVTQILHDKYHDDVPSTLEELLQLPGIGPKMSHLYLQIALGRTEGIGVDIHVHRISNRLGWANSTNPEGTRRQLESWLPREYWQEVNVLFVGFGQQICAAKPKCEMCTIHKLCPAFRGIKTSKKSNKKKRKSKYSETESEESEASEGSETYDSDDDDDDESEQEDDDDDDVSLGAEKKRKKKSSTSKRKMKSDDNLMDIEDVIRADS
ncbi:Endonuclease III [Monocercomonoides exilis]|uniref:Endonuclease III n=1 Tax=Monocercomonoides exilis TaxID=2049356 RepID=UPI003559D0FB|nr:Endonuclease III [Monocercomonoides exilis]|eukprot:MONOS_7901.1-p1 / transcript=MONOS_7901.1 / gene=MONOS_7901 / organism=Monocercomonoides_exilis_PA203 / gene_product=Endonuclease III homolog / transcript_product=Endonuclease III homolog / location=Mono_scaffold00283:30653-31784(+) / protein_length=297 / sequence_SO=supercontig / SO=protein_coding / is_pseudo=false